MHIRPASSCKALEHHFQPLLNTVFSSGIAGRHSGELSPTGCRSCALHEYEFLRDAKEEVLSRVLRLWIGRSPVDSVEGGDGEER